MKANINIYFGSPEDDLSGTYLYLELVILGVGEFEMRATTRLDEEGEADVIEEFVNTLNTAALAQKALNVPVKIDLEEIQTSLIDMDMSESAISEIRDFIREFQKESKGV